MALKMFSGLKKENRLTAFVKNFLLFFPPIVLWGYLFRNFFSGRVMLGHDAWNAYQYINFYVYNIVHGVYPMWNPFFAWGRPNLLHLRTIGEFNPFFYVIPVLKSLGLSLPLSYFIFLVAYYFLGLAGFYLLVKRVTHDKMAAYLGFLLLTFSILGRIIFSSPIVILLFVPTVWFFYFLFAFAQERSKFFFLGMTFSAMLVVITYVPFYFVTMFLILVICLCIFFFRDTISFLNQCLIFIKSHKIFVMSCFLLLVSALIPGFLWYQSTSTGEYYASGHPIGQPAGVVTLKAIAASGVGGWVDLEYLLGGIRKKEINLLYIPIFSYLLLWISIGNFLSKRLVVIFTAGFCILLIILGNLTGVHKFLYEHVVYFKYFRNLHFFAWMVLIPVFVLFCAENFRLFMGPQLGAGLKKYPFLVFLFFMHGVFALFLYWQKNTIGTAYLTVFLSFVFFCFPFVSKRPFPPWVWAIVLLAVTVLQPIEIFSKVNVNGEPLADESLQSWPDFHMRFSFDRPKTGEESDIDKSVAFMRDSSGIEAEKEGGKNIYRGTTRGYFLSERIDKNVLKEYVCHKFIIYDRVLSVEDAVFDFGRFERMLAGIENIAFVSGAYQENEVNNSKEVNAPPFSAEIVSGNGPNFKVLHFDANSIKIKTHFDSKKFLVYNDSFYEGWRAFINGKEAKLYRANYAFKGLWVPAGESIIVLRFGSWWPYALNYLLVGVFNIVFIGLLWLGVKTFFGGQPLAKAKVLK